MPQYSPQDIWNSRSLDKSITTSNGPSGEVSKRRFYKAKNILNNMLIYGNYGLNGNYGDSYLTKCAVYFIYEYSDHYGHYLLYTNGNIKYLSSDTPSNISIDVNKQPNIIGNVYDNQNLLIPCESYGWLTLSELQKLNSEANTGNVTTNNYNHNTFEFLTFVPWSQNQESVIMKVPGDLSEPLIFSQQVSEVKTYYQTRFDYSISEDIPGHMNYYYPKPTIPDTQYFESDEFYESYPYGAFKYNNYVSDKTLIKEKFDIKWYTKSSQSLSLGGEQYADGNYINSYVIKTTGDLYINDQIWNGTDDAKKELLLPFHATGLLWMKEWQGMLQSDGGPNEGIFKALTGVDLNTYWTPTPSKNPPVATCKSKEGVFKDRIYHTSPLYLYNPTSGNYDAQINRDNLKYDQPLFFNMGNMFNELSVYNCAYYLDTSTLGIKRYVKIEVNGDVSTYTTSQPINTSDYPKLAYLKVGNLFDSSSPWALSKTYIALQFYGALFDEEQDYYKKNPGCGKIFTDLTYEDIVNIDKYKTIKNEGTGGNITPPPDEVSPPVDDDDGDYNPPPIDTGDPDEIPPPVIGGTDTTTTTDTTTDTTDTTTDTTDTTTTTSTGIVDLSNIEKQVTEILNDNKSNESNEISKNEETSMTNMNDRLFIGLAILVTIGIIAYTVTSKDHKKSHKKHKKHKQVE